MITWGGGTKEIRTQSGFTIIEFLIGTIAFSVFLLIMTFGLIDFMNDYFKINLATADQNIVDRDWCRFAKLYGTDGQYNFSTNLPGG
jgi:hypothetical protein